MSMGCQTLPHKKGPSQSVTLIKLTINMTSCYEVEEEADEEDHREEDSLREMDKFVATLEVMPMCLN